MLSPETPHPTWGSKPWVQPADGQRGGETQAPQQFRALVKRFSLTRSSCDSSSSTHGRSALNTPSFAGIACEPGSREHKPRHVPIVITQDIIESVLRNLPNYSRSQESLNSTYCSVVRAEGFPGTSRHQPPNRARPRHIPIVIPDFDCSTDSFSSTLRSSETGTLRSSPKTSATATLLSKDMSRPTTSASRTSTLDSSAPSPSQMYAGRFKPSSSTYLAEMNSSESSVNHDGSQNSQQQADQSSGPSRAGGTTPYTTGASPAINQHVPSATNGTNLSGLVCNVHKCTGKEPHALVGATTTVLGDKLYVFGGRKHSRRRPQLTSDLYELDLIRRHWTKVEASGNIPPPRYFHSVCALGDTKLVCYGGMSPASASSQNTQSTASSQQSSEQQPEVVVMSDIHVYDVATRRWTYINTVDTPQGRYAHCATVLPSSAMFTSANAPLSAIHHNPSTSDPNQGSIGVALDGTGGAEMVVVGGQDSANHYIEQISVFNLRSLKWTTTDALGRSCGAYRSVVAPLSGMAASSVGSAADSKDGREEASNTISTDSGSSMLIYSNYNFLEVKLELQIRLPNGPLVEKPMGGQFSPPGLRFPNGGVLDRHFVVSGTYLTSSKQEYALWALDLKNLTWSRIDAGGNVFSQGSWNRGVLWPRHNTFVILGNRKRSLVEDYNHRRINFSNICMVELEAFGIYDNPRRTFPTSAYTSASAPVLLASLQPRSLIYTAGGRPHFSAAEELGQLAMGLRELADMDILSVSNERIPVNSHFLARRWGPYFIYLLREGVSSTLPLNPNADSTSMGSDGGTLRPVTSAASRNSSLTITPSTNNTQSSTSTAAPNSSSPSSATSNLFNPPTSQTLSPVSRSRTLFLPHTTLTIHALLHYLYTSALPPPAHHLSTPQVLCSLLQLARPYKVDGLLEAVVERLHQVLDGRNAAAVFNAAAMAAGGGRGTGFEKFLSGVGDIDLVDGTARTESISADAGGVAKPSGLRIDTSFNNHNGNVGVPNQRPLVNGDVTESDEDDSRSSVSGSTASTSSTRDGSFSAGGSASASGYLGTGADGEVEIWTGEMSSVVGLQKRGLRGLMEGRRMREGRVGRDRGEGSVSGPGGLGDAANRVGLGIASVEVR
ncbi:hypothetical protein MMC20_006627 [Loxospora ochrophaea]|nr:hypothetical protein [Loxospora ochrophaea]